MHAIPLLGLLPGNTRTAKAHDPALTKPPSGPIFITVLWGKYQSLIL